MHLQPVQWSKKQKKKKTIKTESKLFRIENLERNNENDRGK